MKCTFPEGENVCQRCRNSGRAGKLLCCYDQSPPLIGERLSLLIFRQVYRWTKKTQATFQVGSCFLQIHSITPDLPFFLRYSKKELLLQKLREQDNVIKQKDAIMKSLIEQLQDPNKGLTLKEPRVSPSVSSSAIDSQSKISREEPQINKEILEWVERAKASVNTNPGYRMYDGRGAYDSDSPTESSPGSLLSPTKSNLSDSGRSASFLAAPDASQGRGSAKSSPKLLTLPLESTPLGLLAELSLLESKEKKEERSRSKSRSLSGNEDGGKGTDAGSSGEQNDDEDEDGELGPPGKKYWQPAVPWGLRTIQAGKENIPEIMASSLISPAEVDKLFKIFYDRLNVGLFPF
jgi:hypothetical protein